MKQLYSKIPGLLLATIVGLMASSTAFGTATLVIQNGDGPGVGFNDTTPVAPVGGNNGTTLGQQRLIALQFAADIWGATLPSGPTITIRATWEPLVCEATRASLGSAGAHSMVRDFPGSVPGTWYVVALANALRNQDVSASQEINVRFNVSVGLSSSACSNFNYYYGLDTDDPAGQRSLVTVALHEIAHGLGFTSFTNRETGAMPNGFPTIFDRFLLDTSTGKTWPQMTNGERAASAVNTNNLVWNGPQVSIDLPSVLQGVPRLRVNSPPLIAGKYTVGTAQFGAALNPAGVTAAVVQALDPSDENGAATTDGCSALTNAGDVSGKIALIDRGTCIFAVKAKNAQNAGAIGVIIANNVAGSISMGGIDPTITIPAVAITLDEGNTIKAPLAAGVNATLLLDAPAPTMYAPGEFQAGSSATHWDRSLTPDQLMEASTTNDMSHSVVPPKDLSFSLLRDLGWCPAGCATVEWQPVALTAALIAELKAWTVDGRTYVYVKPQFPDAGYRIPNWGQVARIGNDFTVDASVEKFTGASIQAVVTTAQIYDLGPLADGTYNFNFNTSGTLARALQFTVSSAIPPANLIDTAREFVKQQYRDFLNREADQAGEDFWTDNITKCMDPARRPPGQTEAECTKRQRELTSGAFFLSPEFRYTGYYVHRVYQGALGRPPKLSEFTPDALFVGNGIIVNGQLSGAKINQNKAEYAVQFVDCVDPAKYRCGEFKAIYDGLNNQQYVEKLFQTTRVGGASDVAALVNGLNGGTETRATVLQKVVDGINVSSEGNEEFTTTYGQAFYHSEFNLAFVQFEYFGYMKRDPDEAGYLFWLGKLNQHGGNFVNAEMVLAFISSPEYRVRFGQP